MEELMVGQTGGKDGEGEGGVGEINPIFSKNMIILMFLMITENKWVCILPSLLLTNPIVTQHLPTPKRCVYRPNKFKGGTVTTSTLHQE